jgi:DGQHR domain-containing protein
MAPQRKDQWLDIHVIRGNVVGVNVFRGYAKLSDLALMSKADIYDKTSNPQGTQRDLSPKHAQDAYEYIKNHDIAFWPEVFLCTRNSEVLRFKSFDSFQDIGILSINMALANDPTEVVISRVDGNHRLHFADGKDPKFPSLDKVVSFCLAFDLTREEEITLFKDINDNQKAMNTSHLDNIEMRLTPEDELKQKLPDLWIAQKLGADAKSPLHDRVYEGGRKVAGVDIPLRSLRTGVGYILSRSTQLSLLPSVDAQYKVIRNYFSAVKKWQPQGWSKPREYLVIRGAGLWAVCFIGAHVIDNVLLKDEFDEKSMLDILKSGKNWNWSVSGDFKGYSGRGGAVEISKKVIQHFRKKSSSHLFDKIMKDEE